ncbi:SDR family oxidoreductase [Nocardioides sp.]|uniref:SDR family oxidoreductase n=1 Tax=Nocardioides sp. TaxID=35761 RepID=UPI002B266284|nr:SDR family oxidoreductase [Nocardioides sp.]
MTDTSKNGSCVVTGAARGIGRGIAERLVAQGYSVVITDLDADQVALTAREIGAVSGVQQDVRDPESHHRVAREALTHGALRGWFNNAGVGWDGPLVDLDDAQVRGLVEINVLGVFWGMRAALASFEPAGRGGVRGGGGGGDVVNVASLSGLGPVPGLSVYAATKAAVVSATMSVSLEAPKGVGVHAILPDGVATPMVESMKSDGLAKALVSSGGRLLTIEEIAEAAVDLMGSRRVLRTVPAWRGGAMRGSALAPSLAAGAMKVFAAQGRRAQRH